MARTVDTGTPPANVAARDKLKELIMSGEDHAEDSERFVETSPNVIVEKSQAVKGPVEVPTPTINKKVTLLHETHKLTFPVVDVAIADHQIAIRLPMNGFRYEPIALNTEFTVEYLNKKYPVVYLGGIFEFSDSWGIAFIKIKEDDGKKQ